MIKKILISFLVSLWLVSMGGAYLFRKPLAEQVLDLKASEEDWAKSVEVQSLVAVSEKWRQQRTRDEKAERQRALKEGKSYAPRRYDFDLEDSLAKFPPLELLGAINQMRPETAARVIARITEEDKRNFILSKLPMDTRENLQDWIILRQEQEKIGGEKEVLLKQKRRMEAFQASLDTQQKDLWNLRISLLEDLASVQALQEEIAGQFLAVDTGEKKNLSKLADIFNETSPQKVAQMVEIEDSIDERTFVKILSMMDEDAAAAVFESLHPANAARFTGALRTLSQGPTSGIRVWNQGPASGKAGPASRSGARLPSDTGLRTTGP